MPTTGSCCAPRRSGRRAGQAGQFVGGEHARLVLETSHGLLDLAQPQELAEWPIELRPALKVAIHNVRNRLAVCEDRASMLAQELRLLRARLHAPIGVRMALHAPKRSLLTPRAATIDGGKANMQRALNSPPSRPPCGSLHQVCGSAAPHFLRGLHRPQQLDPLSHRPRSHARIPGRLSNKNAASRGYCTTTARAATTLAS